MTTRTVPGSGAILEPVFDDNYSVTRIKVIDGGTGYATTDPPKIEITGTKPPFIEGLFYPLINETTGGNIQRVVVVEPGLGYLPIEFGAIGIPTTTESETRKDIIMQVGGGIGSAIYENGYNVAISTTISGVSSNTTPNFSGQQNIFWGFNDPYIPVKQTSGSGEGASFSVFIVYNSTTGQPISTSVILRDGGRGYSVGDTVSLAGTFMGGSTPTNDLSFVVSKVSSTRISAQANTTYPNVLADATVGFGTGAILSITRDSLGDIGNVSVVFGGANYTLTDNITIAGTYIGGATPQDNLSLSPTVLGTDKLPKILYVDKINNNVIKVSGLSTSPILDITSLGIGTHSFATADPNPNALITVDNIIQTPTVIKNLSFQLNKEVLYNDTIIYVRSGISSISLNDILKINDEYLSVKNLEVDGPNSILVERAVLGTTKDVHAVIDPVFVISGNYNIIDDTIYFASAPRGPAGLPGFETKSTFSGRAFSRRFDPFIPIDQNIILDDISDQFTGIAATEFVLKSNAEDVVGIFTNTNSITGSSSGVDINNNPLVLINNILQVSGKDYIIDTPGRNTIRFIGGAPIAGKITKVGYTTGLGYIPLVGASATVSVSAAGTISNVYLTGFGDGYRSPPIVTIASTVGSGASIVSTIGIGGTVTSLTITNPGSGYTNSILPVVNIDLPLNYNNLNLVYANGYSGLGTGAKASVVVGNETKIISFVLDNPGVGYKVGDQLILSGLTTDTTAPQFEEFRVSVLETFTDTFAGWYPGQFIQFDDISSFFNGSKKKFTTTITQNGIREAVSLKSNPEDLIIENNLFVFINDVLQVPNEAYTFNGSRITFTEAPKPGSKCNLLFYRGSDLDVEQIDPPRTIKEGDIVQIDESILDPLDRPQFERVVKNIVTTDILETFPYDSFGISTDETKIRPLNWTKQTQDRVINGVLYSKARPSLKSRIIPTAKVIKDIGVTDREIYVDSAIPLFADIDETRGVPEDLRDVIILDNREITTPTLRSVVSTSSTISGISILDPGSGYKDIINPEVVISSRFITRKDPIYNWNSNIGISTTLNFNAVGYGTGYISVGSSGLAAVSSNGEDWEISQRIDVDYDFTDVIGFGNNYIAVGQTGKVYRKSNLDINSSWTEMNLLKITQDVLNIETISPSDYSGQFNKIIYNNLLDLIIVVGNSGGLFSSSGITTTSLFENIISFSNLNSVAFNSSLTIAVGNFGDILYTTDGAIWSAISNKSVIQNLNDIIWDGTKFIAVGNNGTIITTTNNPEIWNIVNTNEFNKNIKKLNYNSGLYTILDDEGKLYFSLNLTDWVGREVSNNYINDIISLGSEDLEKWVAVGSTGFISYSTPVFNPAVAISTVVNGGLSEITILNGGFGYSQEISIPVIVETEVVQKEQLFSTKAKGDFGIIKDIVVYESGNIGFGTTSPAIEFTLESENFNSPILPNMEYNPLTAGDYFIISNSNVVCGHALTGITTSLGGMANYPASKVGTATSFIDGIYRVEYTTTPVLGISTVRCIFVPIPAVGPDIIQVNIGINTTGFYGRYSFGVIYDYQNRAREKPKSFIVNKDDGLVGLNTGPLLYRTRGLI